MFRLFRRIKTKEEIEKEIDRFAEKRGNSKEINELKKSLDTDSFYEKLFLLSYEKDKNKKAELLKQAKEIADKVPELNGWPKDKKKFWSIEAFRWNQAIPDKLRQGIKSELNNIIKTSNILSLGSGSYPYLENSVLIDFSEEMLKEAKSAKKKIAWDINKNLPFEKEEFDAVTAIFIINYLSDLKKTLKEAKRVLKKEGTLVIINLKNQIEDFYHSQEEKTWSIKELEDLLLSLNFKVKAEIKVIENKELIFIEAVK